VGGGNSFLTGSREAWDKTFAVDWGGVYNGMRAFVDMVVASEDAYVVNTSSVNGFWASLGPGIPHTAYSAAKFAVKGFTEALIEDFRINAPHVKVAVVMPGHIGTDIVLNSREILGVDLAEARKQMERRGLPIDGLSDDDIQNMMRMFGEMFRESAPLTAEQAATVILDGVRAGKWRILIGDDAVALDEAVRADPEGAYGENGLSLGTITGQ
jgi:NAD(P)-dependent dehydrogenase (short-subunit alcohol dehydrogenase family)